MSDSHYVLEAIFVCICMFVIAIIIIMCYHIFTLMRVDTNNASNVANMQMERIENRGELQVWDVLNM